MSTETPATLDLDAYLARISYAGDRNPTVPVLHALHRAHATHVPFENLDILLGRPIRLDLESLQAKLVRARRGGYCFEQNTLFAAVLERLGFRVICLAARVRLGAVGVGPRTHMLLQVDAEGSTWLADVGFGAGGLLQPIRLEQDHLARQDAGSYRLTEDAGLWVLQSLQGEAWQDLYAFTREPHFAADFDMANYYTSTHPSSYFVQGLTVQLATPNARFLLRNWEFQVVRGKTVTSHVIADDEELLLVLSETFGLDFPAGTRFRCLALPT
jgi:N-hydroxyarylamine O-acetyltransferase